MESKDIETDLPKTNVEAVIPEEQHGFVGGELRPLRHPSTDGEAAPRDQHRRRGLVADS